MKILKKLNEKTKNLKPVSKVTNSSKDSIKAKTTETIKSKDSISSKDSIKAKETTKNVNESNTNGSNEIETMVKTYDMYLKSIKTNENFMFSINTILNLEGIIEYTILQFIARNKLGTTISLITQFGIDPDYAKIVITELVRNKLAYIDENKKIFLTETGKSIVIACNFTSLESLIN